MKLKPTCTIACYFLGSTLVLGGIALAQQRAGGFPQPTPEKQVTVTAIPGVIAAGAQWKLVWQGPDNADGLVGMKDGGILFAQEQPSTVRRLDRARQVHHLGHGHARHRRAWHRLQGPRHRRRAHLLRSRRPSRPMSRNGGTDRHHSEGPSTRWRRNTTARPSGAWANWFAIPKVASTSPMTMAPTSSNAKGKVSLVADKSVRTNGMMLSRDEKTLVVTNGKTLVAWDINPDGTTTNQHDFGMLQAAATATAWPSTTKAVYTSVRRSRHSGVQPGREVPWHHPSAQVRLERRVRRARQESSLRQGRRHEESGRQRVQNPRRRQQQRQSDLSEST